jgi:DNA polymerase III subunit gamma/tau
MVRTIDKAHELLNYEDKEIKRLKDEANKANPDDLLRCLLSLQEGEPSLKFSSHPRILLESLLIKLCHYKRLIPIEELIQDVKEMKRDLNNDSIAPDQPSPVKKVFSQEKNRDELLSPETEGSQREQDNPKVENEINRAEEKKKFKDNTEKVLKNPSVQNFMEKFKAQIISVEPEVNKKK